MVIIRRQKKKLMPRLGSHRRLANEPIPLDFVITETKHGELSQSVNGDSSTASGSLRHLMGHSWCFRQAIGRSAALTKNTQVQIVNSFQITQAAALIPGWTKCEFQDGICDCNCGRWDPDCNFCRC